MTSHLLDLAPCAYIASRDDGIIIYVNQTLCKLLGYTSEELIGKNIESILTVATRIFYNTHFFPLIKLHSKAEEIFLSLLAKDKKDIPVLSNAERRFENGVHSIHCVFIPVHQRKKYEDEILKAKRDAENAMKENRQLQDLKNTLESRTLELDLQFQKQLTIHQDLLQFSKIISHDLQEPLRKIQLFTDVISREQENKLSVKGIAAIKKIHRAADRLRILVKGLDEYVTVDAESNYSDLDLNRIVERAKAKAIVQRQFDDFDLVFAPLPPIEGYNEQMELLFFHLIDNSIQFRDTTRKLHIQISAMGLDENLYKVAKNKYKFGAHIRLTYIDNGVGFDIKYREYVFELLKQINPVSKGLGIGLPLIKKIVLNHSGSLQVQSEPGKGTEFVITLPVKRFLGAS